MVRVSFEHQSTQYDASIERQEASNSSPEKTEANEPKTSEAASQTIFLSVRPQVKATLINSTFSWMMNTELVVVQKKIDELSLEVNWKRFLEGNDTNTGQYILNKITSEIIEKIPDSKIELQRKAREYAFLKASEPQYCILDEEKYAGGIFRCAGTSLSEDIYRSPEGRFYRVPRSMDDALRKRIEVQIGKIYNGNIILGLGKYGQVSIAEELVPNGQAIELWLVNSIYYYKRQIKK